MMLWFGPDWEADWAALADQGEEVRLLLLGVLDRLRDGPPYTDEDPPPDIETEWFYLSPTSQREILSGDRGPAE